MAACNAVKRKHNAKLGKAMYGYRNRIDKFIQKVLLETKHNTAALRPQAELEARVAAVYSKTLAHAPALPQITPSALLQHEQNPNLQKRMIGRKDIDISAMISALQSSDWVRQGIPLYDENEGICPFCQQQTHPALRQSLAAYFDDAYRQHEMDLNALQKAYAADAARIQKQLQSYLDSASPFIDAQLIQSEKQLFDATVSINLQRLSQKQQERSRAFSMDAHEPILARIAAHINAANEQIAQNNHIVSNLRSEKDLLGKQVWKFITTELAHETTQYNQNSKAIEDAIRVIGESIQSKQGELAQQESRLRALQQQTTSIQPTCDAINALLFAYGYKGFMLDLGEEPNTYKIIRENGASAKSTLSEGEKTLISFLYFYHLLPGSHLKAGIGVDQIVVIDDPVSSLDQQAIHIVSMMIRDLIAQVRQGRSNTKQIFLLTHNTTLFSEVTHRKHPPLQPFTDETFWLITKSNEISSISKQAENPIQTAYEMLWKDVRDRRNIPSSLQSILYHLDRFLGTSALSNAHVAFEGTDRLVCRSLCALAHGDAKSAVDPMLHAQPDSKMLKHYLSVFAQIFERIGQMAHYQAMMGSASSEAQ